MAAQIFNMFAIDKKNTRDSSVSADKCITDIQRAEVIMDINFFSSGRRDQLHQISSFSSKDITHNKVYKKKIHACIRDISTVSSGR